MYKYLDYYVYMIMIVLITVLRFSIKIILERLTLKLHVCIIKFQQHD